MTETQIGRETMKIVKFNVNMICYSAYALLAFKFLPPHVVDSLLQNLRIIDFHSWQNLFYIDL